MASGDLTYAGLWWLRVHEPGAYKEHPDRKHTCKSRYFVFELRFGVHGRSEGDGSLQGAT